MHEALEGIQVELAGGHQYPPGLCIEFLSIGHHAKTMAFFQHLIKQKIL